MSIQHELVWEHTSYPICAAIVYACCIAMQLGYLTVRTGGLLGISEYYRVEGVRELRVGERSVQIGHLDDRRITGEALLLYLLTLVWDGLLQGLAEAVRCCMLQFMVDSEFKIQKWTKFLQFVVHHQHVSIWF